jgi:hypothetical protein
MPLAWEDHAAEAAHQRKAEGVDVVAGYIETPAAETEALLLTWSDPAKQSVTVRLTCPRWMWMRSWPSP